MFSRSVRSITTAIPPPCSSSSSLRPLSSSFLNCNQSSFLSLRNFSQSSAAMSGNTTAFFEVQYAPKGTDTGKFIFIVYFWSVWKEAQAGDFFYAELLLPVANSYPDLVSFSPIVIHVPGTDDVFLYLQLRPLASTSTCSRRTSLRPLGTSVSSARSPRARVTRAPASTV